jgi:hypothetical protein
VKPKYTSPQDVDMSCHSDECRTKHEQTGLARRSFLGQALVGGCGDRRCYGHGVATGIGPKHIDAR